MPKEEAEEIKTKVEAAGATVELGEILLASDGKEVHVGRPLLEGALVRAEVLEQVKAPKIIVFKMKRRKKYRRRQGHRQDYTAIQVDDIALPN